MFTQDIKIGELDCRIEGETLAEVCEDTRTAYYLANKYSHDKTAMARAYPKIRPVIAAATMINGIFKTTVISSPESEGSEEAIKAITKAFKASAEKTEKAEGETK